jgi:TPR repeat protein
MMRYGVFLARGQGVPKNYTAAARYLKMSADGGDPEGMFRYAVHLEHGSDPGAAAHLYKLCADNGHLKAIWKYAFCLLTGLGEEPTTWKS